MELIKLNKEETDPVRDTRGPIQGAKVIIEISITI